MDDCLADCSLLVDLGDMDDILNYYDLGVQQDLLSGDIAAIEGQPAARLVLDHGNTVLDHSNTVIGYTVPMDSLGLDPHEIDAFLTDDCPEDEVERIYGLMSADESDRLVAAAAATKMPSAPAHQKRCRDAANDDDVDAGGARGAPRRAVEHTPADREPVVAATTPSLKRDAATQVSEAQLPQEFGSVTPTRDASTQVSEDDLHNDEESWREHPPTGKDLESVDPFEPSALELLPVPDAANGVYGDERQPLPLPFDDSTDLQFEAYTAPISFLDFFCEQW